MQRGKQFRFIRKRLGNKTTTPSGVKYGPYLYRDLYTNELVASWNVPKCGVDYNYTGDDIDYYADALIYYKNY